MEKIYSVPTNTKHFETVKTEILPRPHVIKALLNYSKSLEVQKFTTGTLIATVLN